MWAIAGSTRRRSNPLFAFGHGLSYTTFAYSGLGVLKDSDGGLEVDLNIKNTGSMDSDEVPQVYLGAPSEIPDGVQFPVRALVAFDRIHLAAGESRTWPSTSPSVSFSTGPQKKASG